MVYLTSLNIAMVATDVCALALDRLSSLEQALVRAALCVCSTCTVAGVIVITAHRSEVITIDY